MSAASDDLTPPSSTAGRHPAPLGLRARRKLAARQRADRERAASEPKLVAADTATEEDEIVEQPDTASEGEGERVRLRIRRRLPGRRLDKYLSGRFPRMSRTTIQRLIKQGDITVNSRPSKPSYEFEPGDIIDLVVPPQSPYEVVPENIPLNVIYEDDYLLAINKPINIICHPARATQTGTIANAVAYYASSLSKGSDPFRPGIVHRLDKNTTGVMVIAKTDEAHWRLALQFERRTTQKVYLAVAHGNVELEEDVINVPISNHPTVHDRYVVSGLASRLGGRFERGLGKEAITRCVVAERFGNFTLVHLHPKTGRTHQLRVHMSHIGHPLAGDPFYGGNYLSLRHLTGNPADSAEPFFARQALHAYQLSFMHPILDKPMQISADPPRDIQELLDLLRKHRTTPQTRRVRR